MLSLHLIIKGRVQGVGYRAWCGAMARDLGLNGWVRNMRDGSVEAVISGPDDIVQHMLQACYEGPPAAKIDEIIVHPWLGDAPHGFSRLPTS